MQTLRKTAAVLIFPALAWLGVACEGTGTTEPGAVTIFNPSGGNTHWVNAGASIQVAPGSPGSSCSNPGYSTIQSAVNAAVPTDKIKVCPATYTEQVKIEGTIAAPKNNIQLISVQRWKAVIKAPAVPTPDVGDPERSSIVRVTGADNVTILAFTITGPVTGCTLNYGVRVDNGSANILGNHIIKIRSDPFIACGTPEFPFAGAAVRVGRQPPASAKILGNVLEDYQKNGVTVTSAGPSTEISYNRVLGRSPNDLQAQNGIQVSAGASATVRHNFVAQNIGGGGTGLLFSGAGQVVSEHNTVTSNDYGIFASETAGSSVTESRIRASTIDGVVLLASNDNQVTHNASEHNAFNGVFLWTDAHNNHIVRNQVQDNAASIPATTTVAFGGILLEDASINEVRANHLKSNGTDNGADNTDGIRISAGSDNAITDNKLKRNETHDCHDATAVPAGLGGGFTTSNTWTNNEAGTSYPAGLCGYSDDDGESVTAFGWDPNYPWYTSFEEAANLDWAVGYAEFDLDSILALLPTIRLDLVTRPKPSPGQ